MKRFELQELNKEDYAKTKLAAYGIKGAVLCFVGGSLAILADHFWKKDHLKSAIRYLLTGILTFVSIAVKTKGFVNWLDFAKILLKICTKKKN